MSMEVNQFNKEFPDIAALVNSKNQGAFIEMLEVVRIKKGENLVEYGKPSDKMYLISEGELVISLEEGGSGINLGEAGAGQIVGEISMIEPGPASATVQALEDTAALALSRERFEGFAGEYPADAAFLLREFSKRIARRIRAATASLITVDENGLIILERPAEQQKPGLLQLLSGLFGLGEEK